MYNYRFFLILLIFCFGINQGYGSDKLPSDILNVIYKDYGINTTKYFKIPYGIENVIYRLSDVNNKNYILRVYRNSNLERAQEEANLLSYLERNSKIKTIKILSNKNHNYITKIGNKIFGIFEFIPGQHKTTIETETLLNIIEVVKNLHLICHRHVNEFRFHALEDPNSLDYYFFQLYKHGIIKSREYVNILRIIQNFTRAISNYNFRTVIHRDLSAHNIIFNDKEFYIIDFDDFIVGTPLLELTTFMTRNACLDSKRNIFDIERAEKIIKKYDFTKITGEKFLSEDLEVMLTYDLLILIQAQLQKNCKNLSEKKHVFRQIYKNILLIQDNKQYIINALSID
jgi:Ser/Thr protein kinase RdoA (MazF antagonist)